MSSSIYDPIPKKQKKHIRFDLSKNQTYIIDNNDSIPQKNSYETTQSVNILASLLFFINAILAYINKYYVFALLFSILTIISILLQLYTTEYTGVLKILAITSVTFTAYLCYTKILV